MGLQWLLLDGSPSGGGPVVDNSAGFWVARADSAGARIVASETKLSPAPVDVDYPNDLLGAIRETADGNVIVQQLIKDPRRRSWIWRGYEVDRMAYFDLWMLLESLRSRHRKALGYATPYSWVRDNITQKLRIQDVAVAGGAATSGGAATLSDTTRSWATNAYANYGVEILAGAGAGQFRRVASNTSGTLTVQMAWTTQPDATSVYSLFGWSNPWLRARVVDVQRTVRQGGGNVRFDETRFSFCIEDSAYNDAG